MGDGSGRWKGKVEDRPPRFVAVMTACMKGPLTPRGTCGTGWRVGVWLRACSVQDSQAALGPRPQIPRAGLGAWPTWGSGHLCRAMMDVRERSVGSGV